MRKILTITCGSFTVVMMLFVLFSPFRLAPEVTNATALQGFVMSVSIAVIMVLAEKIDLESIALDVLTKALICYLVVFLEGAFFGMVPFSWKGLWEITPVLIPAFIITYVIEYLVCVEWASFINHKIKRKKQDA